MYKLRVLALIFVSLATTKASNAPFLTTAALLKGVSDIPHFVWFYKTGSDNADDAHDQRYCWLDYISDVTHMNY